MKIYSKVVFSMKTGGVISEKFKEYTGPIAECKGGSSTTTTVDPVYNAGLLEISKEQQGWANQMFNMFKYGVTYDPTEEVTGYYDKSGKFIEGEPPETVASSKTKAEPEEDAFSHLRDRWVSAEKEEEVTTQQPAFKTETRTRGEIQGYDAGAQTSEMQYLQNLVNANQSLLGLQTDLSRQTLESQQKLLPQQTAAQEQRLGLYSTTMEDINKGIDVKGRMDQAQASVQHAFKNANATNRMDIASYGLDPSSGRYASQNRAVTLAESAGVAGARTGAKNYAESEDFERKKAGLSFNI